MAYTDRTAVTGDPINITFAKLVDLPAAPDIDAGIAPPQFLTGMSVAEFAEAQTYSSNMPMIWADVYNDPGLSGNETGACVFGASHADYGLIESGTGVTANLGAQFNENGYIDGAYFGLNRVLVPADADVDLSFYRQSFGEFTGGTATPISFGAVETQTIDLAIAPYSVLSNVYPTHVIPSLASTRAAPEALFVTNLQFETGDPDDLHNLETYHGLKMGLAGSVTKISLFKADAAVGVAQTGISTIVAHSMDATYHYFVRTGPSSTAAYTRCIESTFGSYSYNNYTPLFDDPDLPASLADLLNDTDPTFEFSFISGCEYGFIIGYKINDGGWSPKFILVDKDWTEVRHIIATAGDATAAEILSNGANSYNEANFALATITMMAEDGYVWLLGGTPEVPLIVEATLPPDIGGGSGDGGDGLQDTSVRLRVWAYGLDGHKHIVWRIGPSETLVFDPTTNTWSSWASPGRDNWRAHVGQNWIGMSADTLERGFGSDVVAGDDASGVLWVLDPTIGRDDRSTTGDDPFNRIVTGGLSLSGREVAPCGALQLDYSMGNPTQAGATFTLETSDDWGNTFDSHGSVTVSADDFAGVVEWRALGQARAPGRVFRITDNGAAVRLSGADLR